MSLGASRSSRCTRELWRACLERVGCMDKLDEDSCRRAAILSTARFRIHIRPGHLGSESSIAIHLPRMTYTIQTAARISLQRKGWLGRRSTWLESSGTLRRIRVVSVGGKTSEVVSTLVRVWARLYDPLHPSSFVARWRMLEIEQSEPGR